jgi:hypothetical protein
MSDVLYRKVIVPMKDSPDGETPSVLSVVSLSLDDSPRYAIVFCEYDNEWILELHWRRDAAIEHGVAFAQNDGQALAQYATEHGLRRLP